ncbi:hypothetical protein WI90_20900 [Burkholderia ubonensis]|nr:hypothetical protein WI90_20900 [Burkholderia ubonensis]
MGFYTPPKLLQDAKRRDAGAARRRHTVSTWDSTIEGPTTSAPMRLGFSLLRGTCEEAAGRIELARANALRTLAGGNRRAALWLAAAAVPGRDLLRGTARDDAAPALPPASEGKVIVTDYRAMGFTLGRHPLALLRDRLKMDRLQTAEQLATLRNGQLARACGLVTVRQRPGTANGVLFVTLEDETGQVNVILWPGLLKKFRKEALSCSPCTAYARLGCGT